MVTSVTGTLVARVIGTKTVALVVGGSYVEVTEAELASDWLVLGVGQILTGISRSNFSCTGQGDVSSDGLSAGDGCIGRSKHENVS